MSEHVYRRMTIGVIGASAADEETAQLAAGVGALVCRRGANLVCGGLGGVMMEACRGFVEERYARGGKECGVTIGILPGGDRRDANPFVDIIVPTDLGMMRNFLVVQAADILVAVAGGSGTLCEMSIAWQRGKTIIAMSGAEGWAAKLAGTRIDGRRPDTVIKAATVEEVDRALDRLLSNAPA